MSLGPVEKATQAPGEVRVIPRTWMTAKVAQIAAARRLLDECNGNRGLALDILVAVDEERLNG